MKTWTRNSLSMVLAVIFCCSLFAGCKNNANIETPSVKRSRLIALENAQLKKDLENQKVLCQKQLANQKKRTDRGIKRLNNALDNCKKENQSLQQISKGGIESYMSDIVGPLSDRVVELEKENEALKGQIEQLKKQ